MMIFAVSIDRPNDNKSNKWKKISSLLLAAFLISAAYAIILQYSSSDSAAQGNEEISTPLAIAASQEGTSSDQRKTITLVAQDAELENK